MPRLCTSWCLLQHTVLEQQLMKQTTYLLTPEHVSVFLAEIWVLTLPDGCHLQRQVLYEGCWCLFWEGMGNLMLPWLCNWSCSRHWQRRWRCFNLTPSGCVQKWHRELSDCILVQHIEWWHEVFELEKIWWNFNKKFEKNPPNLSSTQSSVCILSEPASCSSAGQSQDGIWTAISLWMIIHTGLNHKAFKAKWRNFILCNSLPSSLTVPICNQGWPISEASVYDFVCVCALKTYASL